jgi:hypothetical protein
MPLFDRGDKKIHFIHIPRTGGRYISKLFEINGFVVQNGDIKSPKLIDGVLAIHLYNPLYKVFSDYNERIEFCVVRNPFDKFISSISQMHLYHKIDYNYILESEEKFNTFINEEIEISSKHNCWFLEQNKFISEKTKIWKYENGFGKDFLEWIEFNLGVEINNTTFGKEIYNKNIWNDEYEEKLWDKKYKFNDMNLAEKYIKNFYKKDYKIFEY